MLEVLKICKNQFEDNQASMENVTSLLLKFIHMKYEFLLDTLHMNLQKLAKHKVYSISSG